MSPKIKEDPREWRKFLLVMVTATTLLTGWLVYRHRLPPTPAGAIFACLAIGLFLGLWRPRLVRPIYRTVMTGSFYVGQVVGRVLLALVFGIVLTPLALVMRWMGHDGLGLRRDPGRASYWRVAKPMGPFDRQF